MRQAWRWASFSPGEAAMAANSTPAHRPATATDHNPVLASPPPRTQRAPGTRPAARGPLKHKPNSDSTTTAAPTGVAERAVIGRLAKSETHTAPGHCLVRTHHARAAEYARARGGSGRGAEVRGLGACEVRGRRLGASAWRVGDAGRVKLSTGGQRTLHCDVMAGWRNVAYTLRPAALPPPCGDLG